MYCFDVKTIVLVGMIIMSQIGDLTFLFDRRLCNKHRALHYMMLASLIFWCLFALLWGGLMERMYAGITLMGMTAVEVLVRRRRKLEQQMPTEQH